MDCIMCKGSLIDSTTNHVVSLKNSIIIVKDVPCQECVQCGEKYFDDSVTMELERIVGQLRDSIPPEIAVVQYRHQVA